MNIIADNSKIFSKIQKLNLNDLIIFLIPAIIFLFYLTIYNPGILTYDSFNQLHQIATGEFNNWHPFFHTFIEMICVSIYGSPASVGVLQIFTFSTMWMIICKYNRDDNAPASIVLSERLKFNRRYLIQVILTLAICLIPINAIYSITLWKDVLFSYFLLFLCFLIQVLLDKKGNVSFEFIVLLSLVMSFVAQLRLNGVYIIILLLIVLAIYLFKKNETDRWYLVLPALTIIFILFIASLNIAFDVEDTHKDGVFAKVSHMLADYDMNGVLSTEDGNKLHEMISEKDIGEKYDIYFTDPIRDTANRDVYDNNKGTYIGMAISNSLSHPWDFIRYMLGSSAMAWDLTRDADWQGRVYYINEDGVNLEHAKENFYSSRNITPQASYEDVTGLNEGSDIYNGLNSIVYTAESSLSLDTLFNSPALYMYLAFIIMAAIYFITKSKDILLIYLPNFLNILTVFVSTPIQDNRYLYANLLVCYLMIIILIGLLYKKPLKSTVISSNRDKVKDLDLKQEEIYNDIESEIDMLSLDDINNILGKPKKESIQKETPEEMEARIRAKVLNEMEEKNKNSRFRK